MPPLSGFFSKDEIISQAFLRDDYGLWVVGIVAAAFTAVYMTRLIWLTFYGNARYETLPGVTTVPIVSGGSGEDEPRRVSVAESTPTTTTSPTATRRRRCRYGDPVPEPVGHAPHESPPIMIFPIMVLAVLAAIGGLMNLPFTSMEWLDKWLESSFRGVPEVAPRHLHRRIRAGDAHVRASRSCGIFLAYTLYKKGLEHADRDPLEREARRASLPSSATPTTTTPASPGWSAVPGRAVAELARPCGRHTRSSTARSNGVGSLFDAPSRGVATAAGRPGAALRARHHRRRRGCAPLRRDLAGAVDAWTSRSSPSS